MSTVNAIKRSTGLNAYNGTLVRSSHSVTARICMVRTQREKGGKRGLGGPRSIKPSPRFQPYLVTSCPARGGRPWHPVFQFVAREEGHTKEIQELNAANTMIQGKGTTSPRARGARDVFSV